MIAAGHGRWLAARKLGVTEVPVIRAGFLNEADRRAFALAENRIAQLSGWDEDLFGQELAFPLVGGNLEIPGFTTADLDFSVPETKKEKGEEVEVPDPDTAAVSRVGDLWHIGPRRLYCSDACGRDMKGTKQRLMFRTLTARAPSGDVKAATILLPLILKVLGIEDRGGAQQRLSPQDQALLDELLGTGAAIPDLEPDVLLGSAGEHSLARSAGPPAGQGEIEDDSHGEPPSAR